MLAVKYNTVSYPFSCDEKAWYVMDQVNHTISPLMDNSVMCLGGLFFTWILYFSPYFEIC